jgi:hypothetical protein
MRKGFTDAFLARFSQVRGQASFESIFICVNEFSAIPRWMRVLAQTSLTLAQITGTGLWTACTRLKTCVLTNAYFSLTEKIEGVQQDRSLTAS